MGCVCLGEGVEEMASHSQPHHSLKVLKSSLLLMLVVKRFRRCQALLHDPCSLRLKGVSSVMLGGMPGCTGGHGLHGHGGGVGEVALLGSLPADSHPCSYPFAHQPRNQTLCLVVLQGGAALGAAGPGLNQTATS